MIAGVAVRSIGFLAFLGVFFVRSSTALADRKLLHGEFRDFDGVRKRAMLVGFGLVSFEVVRGRKMGVVGSSDVLGGVLGGVLNIIVNSDCCSIRISEIMVEFVLVVAR